MNKIVLNGLENRPKSDQVNAHNSFKIKIKKIELLRNVSHSLN